MGKITQHPSLSLDFHDDFTSILPGDPITSNYRRQVNDACYSFVRPCPVPDPELITYSPEAAHLIGLSADYCESDEFVKVFSGNGLLPGMQPYAMCYGGHQFGNWTGQLGDGRAINLGEVHTTDGRFQSLQLKGAGETPYSRNADGMAVLRSSIREFLCSEAMHHLGVPTTRALSLISTGERVERDMFYDGRIKEEPGAVVCRVSPSFIRFGNFEIHTARREIELLRRLTDYTISKHFPGITGDSPARYLDFFGEVCRLTLDLVVHWMRVGFVHGVMNTDNMSILGLTIDYGPYGWLEGYQPDWTPNTTDAAGRRYCFGNQPAVSQWNLAQLANALYPLVEETDGFEHHLKAFAGDYRQGFGAMMASKLGLTDFMPETDLGLIEELTALLGMTETDMTIFYRALAEVDPLTVSPEYPEQWLRSSPLMEAYYTPGELGPEYIARLMDWLKAYGRRMTGAGIGNDTRREAMNRVNPRYVLRNYLVQLAIDDAESGDYAKINELLRVMKKPYTEQPGMAEYAAKRPEWARNKPGCSMLSCSS